MNFYGKQSNGLQHKNLFTFFKSFYQWSILIFIITIFFFISSNFIHITAPCRIFMLARIIIVSTTSLCCRFFCLLNDSHFQYFWFSFCFLLKLPIPNVKQINHLFNQKKDRQTEDEEKKKHLCHSHARIFLKERTKRKLFALNTIVNCVCV